MSNRQSQAVKAAKYKRQSASMKRSWAEIRKHPRKYRARCRTLWPKYVDLEGKKFGNLTVVKVLPNRGRNRDWLCKRPCEHTIAVRTPELRDTGKRACRQCSFWNTTVIFRRKRRTAREWCQLLGITGPCLRGRLERGLSITEALRQGKDGGHKFVTVKGERHSLAEWARKLGCSRQVIDMRLKNRWNPQRAVTQPLNKFGGRTPVFLSYKGRRQTIAQWVKETGLSKSTIYQLHQRGLRMKLVLQPIIPLRPEVMNAA